MLLNRMLRQGLAIAAAISMVTVWPVAPVLAADVNVNLDGNSVNGNESNVALNVVNTSPTAIKDKVTNKAVGQAFRFAYAAGGPGGFYSSVPLGTTTGVGAIWNWQTNQQVYSIPGGIVFTQTAPGTVVRSFTGLPGRSLTQAGVTTSSASLTSSLITFFSPPVEKVRVTSSVTPVAGGLFKFETEVKNLTDAPIQYNWQPGPLGCSSEECGNGTAEGSEQCDGSDLNDASCEVFGGSGTLGCDEGCNFDLSGCVDVCGNGVRDGEEQCEGSNLGEQTCVSQGYAGGELACNSECSFDYSGCVATVCGNGVREGSEVCDGSDLNGENCGTRGGFECGTLACQEDCSAFDTSGCIPICFGGGLAAPLSSGGTMRPVNLLSKQGAASARTSTGIAPTSSRLASSGRQDPQRTAGSSLRPVPQRRPAPRQSTMTLPLGDVPVPCSFPGQGGKVDPNSSLKTCQVSGHPAKEVTSQIVVCGDGLPSGPQGCGTAQDSGTQGTANVFVPALEVNIGDAFLSVDHVAIQDGSNGFAEPGETFNLLIALNNTGSSDLTNVTATLSAIPVDIDGDGTPDAPTITQATSAYPTIPGMPAGTGDCDSPAAALTPVYNITPFVVTLPAGFPIDTNVHFELAVNGTASGSCVGEACLGAFNQNVNFVVGVGSACSLTNLDGSYTKVDGFLSPMNPLVPAGDPFPESTPLSSKQTRPLKVRIFCGTTNLTDNDIAAPQIVSLTRDGVPIDVNKLDLNDNANSDSLFFRYSSGFWIYNMRTKLLGHGTFVITIRFANGQEYQSQFVQ
jgi:hypothetical protein